MRTGKRRLPAIILSLALMASLAPLAGPAGAVGTFDDDDGNIHESAIEKIAALGITKGCNPPANNLYCPDDYVTRQQMASFLVRTFELPAAPAGQFTDTANSVHKADIDALAASGITKGCNPPANTQYCPTQQVTRGQMAAFMARGLELADVTEDYFGDDNGNIFEFQINAIARIGITKGCNPPVNDQYCPDRPVRRDEMATFLSRVSDIHQTGTTVTTSDTTSTTTTSSTTTTTTVPLTMVPCPGTAQLDCTKAAIDYKPTSIEWYGDKLYVLSVSGAIHRYVVGGDGSLGSNGVFNTLPAPEAGTTYTALGMAIEPGSSATSPTVWITTSITGGANYLEGVANSSTAWRIQDIRPEATATPIITGLPRSYENHSINSIHFDNGQLYIAQGGNTGAGAANSDTTNSEFGTRPEQPLSATWLRADVLGDWDPDSNGDCATAVDDGPPPTFEESVPSTCDVEILATGIRNMYDFVFHSNGKVYGPDNGLGVNGTVPDDPLGACDYFIDPYDDLLDPGSQPDRMNILVEGNYYGHPNPARDECVFFDGSFQGVSADPDYVAGQVLTGGANSTASLNSIVEYDSDGAAATSAWDGHMLMTGFSRSNTGIFRYDPAETCDTEMSAWANGCLPQTISLARPLGIELLPGGRLAVGEWVDRQSDEEQYLVILTPTTS